MQAKAQKFLAFISTIFVMTDLTLQIFIKKSALYNAKKGKTTKSFAFFEIKNFMLLAQQSSAKS